MRLQNDTKHRIPRKWLETILNHLGVNPQITIVYSDNPDEVEIPNYKHSDGGDCDGMAFENNRVYLFVGKWFDGVWHDWTAKYLKWVLCHELRHQYYYYHKGNYGDPWEGLSDDDRIRREEAACNRFANLTIGVPKKDFPIYQKDVNKNKA